MNRAGKKRFQFRSLTLLALGWLIVAVVLLIQFLPDLPQTKLQWALLVLFGPPLYVLGEAIISGLFSERRGLSVTSKGFSLKRILIALPLVMALFALCWWVFWLLSRGGA